jgi:hypothetical protein
LERRLPPADQDGPASAPVILPPLAEFQAMPLEEQRYILLCWEPPPSAVTFPPWDEVKQMPLEDAKRLMDEMERPGREALLLYAESLPLADRIQLLLDATQTPGCEIWRLHTLRFACRPEWRRRADGDGGEPKGEKLWA